MNDDFLNKKLDERKAIGAFRQLRLPNQMIDFCSNDYLGMVKNKLIAAELLTGLSSGSTGSRLLAGNYALIEETEQCVAAFHDAEAALIFNSGYDTNIGLIACMAARGDTILYDALSHASIRDGIRLSFADAFSFEHNNVNDLALKLQKKKGRAFVVTESVFSMDGDLAPLKAISELCKGHDALLIVDEAHATGVIGERGEGLVQQLGLQQVCFARVHTFGKAVGCHGAVVLGSKTLRDYLINFSRSFIYTTAMPPVAAAAIKAAYAVFPRLNNERAQLSKLMNCFPNKNPSPIQSIIVPGNAAVKKAASKMAEGGFDVRPILYPTVPKGTERLRVVLHSFNTETEVCNMIDRIKQE